MYTLEIINKDQRSTLRSSIPLPLRNIITVIVVMVVILVAVVVITPRRYRSNETDFVSHETSLPPVTTSIRQPRETRDTRFRGRNARELRVDCLSIYYRQLRETVDCKDTKQR